jgi:prepilin-type N-terminal cleavage/methylation domain-containing protein
MVQSRRTLLRRGAGGFTLVELLVAIAILGLVASAVAAISLGGLLQTSDGASERHLDGSTAQFVARTFASDVQGAAGVSDDACPTPAGTPLLTLEPSATTGATVSYLAQEGTAGFDLVRATCRGPRPASARTVVRALIERPGATCDGQPCSARSEPRTVSLTVTRTDRFDFRLVGARRGGNAQSDPDDDATIPRDPVFFALGGSVPLKLAGNGTLGVRGNMYVNADGGDAIVISGGNPNAVESFKLEVDGELRIEQGGSCRGCRADNVAPWPPGSFSQRLPDPYAALPRPSESGMVNHGTRAQDYCPGNVCQPGIYPRTLKLNRDSFVLEPGIYVLRDGLNVGSGARVRGIGIMLFNQGSVSVGGGGRVELSPPTSGLYQDILLFQARGNTSPVSVSSGNSESWAICGVMYAPSSSSFDLAGGTGGLRLGTLIGRSLDISGEGRVQVSGLQRDESGLSECERADGG